MRVGRASASGIGRLFSGIGATCCFSNISVSPLTESMCMARHLGHCERGGADSSRKTVRMGCSPAGSAGFVGSARTHNHAVFQVGYSLSVGGRAVTQAPVGVRRATPQRDGEAVARAAEGTGKGDDAADGNDPRDSPRRRGDTDILAAVKGDIPRYGAGQADFSGGGQGRNLAVRASGATARGGQRTGDTGRDVGRAVKIGGRR